MVNVALEKLKLIQATLNDYSIIQNMARFYVYDMTEYMGFEPGWEIPENGLYECIDFKKYWSDKDATPLLVHYENELVGFAIIDKKGSDTQVDYNMAQFFILRKFKSKGVGRYVATACFSRFKGVWEIMVIPENKGAYSFWKSVVGEFTQENFTEYTKKISHLGDATKNIFRFKSLG